MGNLLTVIVNAVLEEITKKVRSLGYHSYNVDYDKNFTIDGIRNNPKCKLTIKKTTISAEDLFVLEDVSKDANNKLSICIKVPQILLNIGKGGFACGDPKLRIAVKGWIKFTDIYLTLTVSVNMTNNGLQLDHISVKPKITEVKSDIQLALNDKQCSEFANSMLCSQDPTLLNFVLEFILKTQEESLMKFINSHMQEAQKRYLPSVSFTVNTNLTTPLKQKSIEQYRLQSVPNNYTYIHRHTLENHNPPSGAVG